MLRYIVIFSTLLIKIVQVRAECDIPTIGENRIMDREQQMSFPEGSTIKYKCSPGYVPVRSLASKTITCNGTHWSELQLQCKKKSCGNPGEIPYGKYLYQPTDGVLFGAVIRAECSEGYQLVGNPIRNCRENGWDGRNPTCDVMRCEPPPSVKDGEFEPNLDIYDFQQGVTYSCKRGLDLIGADHITCSSDGTFQPAPPQCLRVSCEKPEIPHADRIEGKSPPYKYGQFVRYRCQRGYKMEGSDTLTCEEKGWNPPPPQCTVITCVNPPNITHGEFNPKMKLYEYEQKVTYSCNEGFKLIGDPSISCTLEGIFEPLPAQCSQIQCDLQNILNGIVIGSNGPKIYNDQVQIRCSEGYIIVGPSIVTCKEPGWSPPLPYCREVTCNAPEIPKAIIYGEKKSIYKYNSSLHIKCEKGYLMEGTDHLTCKENGWNPPPPKCNLVTCKPPPHIDNGQFDQPKQLYEYGQTVIYSCNKGFKLEGDSITSCDEHGRFNVKDPPKCLVATCDEPNFDNGFVIKKSSVYKYDESVQVQCKTGYHIKGSDVLTCKEKGWTPAPQCSFSHWIWILAVTLPILACSACCCYKKFRKHKESAHGPWAEGCDDAGML